MSFPCLMAMEYTVACVYMYVLTLTIILQKFHNIRKRMHIIASAQDNHSISTKGDINVVVWNIDCGCWVKLFIIELSSRGRSTVWLCPDGGHGAITRWPSVCFGSALQPVIQRGLLFTGLMEAAETAVLLLPRRVREGGAATHSVCSGTVPLLSSGLKPHCCGSAVFFFYFFSSSPFPSINAALIESNYIFSHIHLTA